MKRFRDWILYEDEGLLAINKPAGIASLDERSGEGTNLLQLARQYVETAQLCHRLDKDTSGVLLVAKNPETYRQVSMALESREVTKVYHAVVEGTFAFNNLSVDFPIYVDSMGKVKIDRAKGKESQTIFNTLRFYNHFTLVECRPVTGRMHQIRVHLASQFAPICNDTLYGGKPPYLSALKRKFKLGKSEEEQPMIRRFALHAYSIEIPIENGKKRLIQAPYPKDFDVFIKLLEKYDV